MPKNSFNEKELKLFRGYLTATELNGLLKTTDTETTPSELSNTSRPVKKSTLNSNHPKVRCNSHHKSFPAKENTLLPMMQSQLPTTEKETSPVIGLKISLMMNRLLQCSQRLCLIQPVRIRKKKALRSVLYCNTVS